MCWEWPLEDRIGLSRYVTAEAIQLLPISTGDRLQLLQTSTGRLEVIRAIYDALVDRSISYAYEQYQPNQATQLIRTPHEVLVSPRDGTCLDLALLFCGLCLGYNLLPLLVVIERHAFVGISLTHQLSEHEALMPERTFVRRRNLPSEEYSMQLRTWVHQGQYVMIECTGFARTQSFNDSSEPEAQGRNSQGYLYFERAIEAGREQLYSQTRSFQYAIDIAVARYDWNIQPMPFNVNPERQEENGRPITTNLANRHHEITTFTNLINLNEYKILLIQGESGMGKTTLQCEFSRQYGDQNISVVEDFELNTYYEIDAWLKAMKNIIRIQLEMEDNFNAFNTLINSENREISNQPNFYGNLIWAFVSDLRNINRPILIILDSFDEAPSEIQQLIRGDLLTVIGLTQNQIKIVVLGEQCPSPSPSWRAVSLDNGRPQNLGVIMETEYWIQYLHTQYPGEELRWSDEKVEEIVQEFEGNPLQINLALRLRSR